MTEEIDLQAESPVDEPQVESEAPEPVMPKATAEKVIARERQKAYEKGRKEAMAELEAAQQAPQAAQSMGGMQQASQEDIRRMIAEQAPQVFEQHVNQMRDKHVVDSFVSKIQAAEGKYPGLQEKLADLNYNPVMRTLVEMANEVPNSADVMNELIENPEKMSIVLGLIRDEQPKLAYKKMQSLGSSIKQNEDAKAADVQARDPMSQLRPSTNAGMDNGAASIADFRKMFKV